MHALVCDSHIFKEPVESHLIDIWTSWLNADTLKNLLQGLKVKVNDLSELTIAGIVCHESFCLPVLHVMSQTLFQYFRCVFVPVSEHWSCLDELVSLLAYTQLLGVAWDWFLSDVDDSTLVVESKGCIIFDLVVQQVQIVLLVYFSLYFWVLRWTNHEIVFAWFEEQRTNPKFFVVCSKLVKIDQGRIPEFHVVFDYASPILKAQVYELVTQLFLSQLNVFQHLFFLCF